LRRRHHRNRRNGSQRPCRVRHGGRETAPEASVDLQSECTRPSRLSDAHRDLRTEDSRHLSCRIARLLALHDDNEREPSLDRTRRLRAQPRNHYRRSLSEGRSPHPDQEIHAQIYSISEYKRPAGVYTLDDF